jgi:hypothetical protein
MSGALSNKKEDLKNWEFVFTEKYGIKLKWYVKKHPNETKALIDRLDTYIKTLNICNEPQQIKPGWLHNEPHGVKAITENGKGGSLKAARLYFFPNKEERTIELLTIGDKNTQSDDIKFCNDYMTKRNNIKSATQRTETSG